MRMTIILATATSFLAGVSVVTGLARTVHGPIGETISARPVVHPLTTGSLTASVVPAT
jgi:predicted aconitase with swiveling domain